MVSCGTDCREKVQVEKKGTDRYGRILGVVYIDGKNVNEEMVRKGFAWHYKQYNKDKRLAQLELKARERKLNIWNMKNPIEPHQFRKAKRESQNIKKSDNMVKPTEKICGARTKSGSKCKRKVTNGNRCWQHK